MVRKSYVYDNMKQRILNSEKQLQNHQGGKEGREHQILGIKTCNT